MSEAVKMYNLAILGFGNVGRALVGLLRAKADELRTRYGITFRITGVASRRLGWLSAPNEIDVADAILLNNTARLVTSATVQDWLAASRANVLFELSSLNAQTGQPAIDHLRAALEHGAHAITANKGPMVFAYRELRDLAARKGKAFLYESTVMGGTPVFSLFRGSLPATKLHRVRGLVNSTSSIILEQVEAGLNFEEGVKRAQDLGLAETDPSADIDGWDSAVKLCAIANVLMDYPLRPDDLSLTGIRGLLPEQVRAARAEGRKYRLVASAERIGNQVIGMVAPELLEPDDILAAVNGASMIATFYTDIFEKGLTISEHDGTVESTAYGVLADFIQAAKG